MHKKITGSRNKKSGLPGQGRPPLQAEWLLAILGICSFHSLAGEHLGRLSRSELHGLYHEFGTIVRLLEKGVKIGRALGQQERL
jgi:hypothetical protein